MNHPFEPSGSDPLLCAKCKHKLIDHTDRATCDNCGASGTMNLTSNDDLLCPDCDFKDLKPRTTEELNSRALEVRRRFTEIDNGIKISTDIFNAKTIAIHELKKAIDADPTIPNEQKYFTLAKHIEERFNNLTDIIFSQRQVILEAENEQRAIQTYYNDLGKKLRAEEREQIRLKDVTYKPLEPKVTKTPKAPTTKKVDVNAIKEACVKGGIPEAMAVIMMLCTAKKISPEEAVETFKLAKAGK